MAKDNNVLPPRTTGGSPDDTQLWESTPHGDIWRGFFIDAETALAWVRKNPGNYTLNNVTPSAKRGEPVRGVVKRRASVAPKKTTRSFFDEPRRPRTKVTTVLPKSKAQKALEKEAQARLSQHQTDEAAEMEKEDS